MNYKLIGYPLGHSMSPWIHEHLFAMSGKKAEYALCEIAPESLEQAIPELQTIERLQYHHSAQGCNYPLSG